MKIELSREKHIWKFSLANIYKTNLHKNIHSSRDFLPESILIS